VFLAGKSSIVAAAKTLSFPFNQAACTSNNKPLWRLDGSAHAGRRREEGWVMGGGGEEVNTFTFLVKDTFFNSLSLTRGDNDFLRCRRHTSEEEQLSASSCLLEPPPCMADKEIGSSYTILESSDRNLLAQNHSKSLIYMIAKCIVNSTFQSSFCSAA
jgi:hypothetical protein